MTAKIYLHPTLLARRAGEIAKSHGATRLEQDARGRPFIMVADPLAEAPAAGPGSPWACAWLIRVLRALGREAGPPVGRPAARRR